MLACACSGASGIPSEATDIEPAPSNENSDEPLAPSNETLEGAAVRLNGAVQKGPFIVGSSIQVSNLDANANPTGAVFSTSTVNDLGQFALEFEPTALTSLEGAGYYYNEVTGSLSVSPLTLRALYSVNANASQDAYVNLVTHLTYGRVRRLITDGVAFETARAQAELELQSGLGIVPPAFTADADGVNMNLLGGDSDGNAYLLAVSAVLAQVAQLESPAAADAALQQLLNQIASDLEQTGEIATARRARVTTALQVLNTTAIKTAFAARLATLGSEATVPDLDRVLDQDGDGIGNLDDNCQHIANADQADADDNGVGNACDADADGVNDRIDNCPAVANPTQSDADADSVGDACDSCTNGQTRCDGVSTVEVCSAGVWTVQEQCGIYANEYTCEAGACTTDCGEPGLKYCEPGTMHICDETGQLRLFEEPVGCSWPNPSVPADLSTLPIAE